LPEVWHVARRITPGARCTATGRVAFAFEAAVLPPESSGTVIVLFPLHMTGAESVAAAPDLQPRHQIRGSSRG